MADNWNVLSTPEEQAAAVSEDQYLPINGGTMKGPLILDGDPEQAKEAATKAYVDDTAGSAAIAALNSAGTYTDNVVSGYLPISGGIMSGALTLSGDPTSSGHAATKGYVDTAISGGIASATSSANGYTDTALSGYLPFSGGTLTGTLTLSGAPTSGSDAATKDYVDSAGSAATSSANGYTDTALSGYLPISGGSVTGSITLGSGAVISGALAGNADSATSAGSAGSAGSAAVLTSARTILTNLAASAAASFDGSADVTPGVSGALPIANGGTGKTTAADAFEALSAINYNSDWSASGGLGIKVWLINGVGSHTTYNTPEDNMFVFRLKYSDGHGIAFAASFASDGSYKLYMNKLATTWRGWNQVVGA